jgi:hypothetical protein
VGSSLFASQEVMWAWSKCGLGGGCLLGVSWECPSNSESVSLWSPCAGAGLVQLPILAVITLSGGGVGVATEAASWVTLGAGSRSEVRRHRDTQVSTGSRGLLSRLVDANFCSIVLQVGVGSRRIGSFKFVCTTGL